MLAFLLDEQISPMVLDQLRVKRPGLRVESVLRWRGGNMRGTNDELVLQAAREEMLTLVTYDQKTVMPLALQWMAVGRRHAGIIFIDEKTISQGDIGGKVRALVSLWDTWKSEHWENAVFYLTPST